MTDSNTLQEQIRSAVFVIESPSPSDFLDDRSEGETLHSCLRLAQIPSKYYRVVDLPSLREALNRVAIEVRTQTRLVSGVTPSRTIFAPHFHISAHGNEKGLALTSGEFIDWSKLGNFLREFAEKTGHITERACLLGLSLSTCLGGSAKSMFEGPEPYPCFAIIGPETEVAWADAMTAFITFYHLFITKDVSARDAVTAMNHAAGLEGVFQCHVYTAGLEEHGGPGERFGPGTWVTQ